MIKSFEQFINENYNERPAVMLNEEYGAPLFNEISEQMLSEICNSINEGTLVIDDNILEEGIFSTIGKLFRKSSDEASAKEWDNFEEIKSLKDHIESMLNVEGNVGNDIEKIAKLIKKKEIEKDVLHKIAEICNMADGILEKYAEKEEDMYNTISEKMTAINDSIKDFTEKAIKTINDIIETSKTKIEDVVTTLVLFYKKMVEKAKSALEILGKGCAIAFVLPFILAFAIYKGTLNVCKKLVEKAKDGVKVIKEIFSKIKEAISNWVVECIKKAKEILISAYDSAKDGVKKTYKYIGKSYLTIVAILGQLASDAKDSISEAYNSFIKSADKFSDDVKKYISDKWNAVSKWCKQKSTSFAEGVKNVWEKTKEKVMGVVGAAKDSYKALENNAKSTWDDVKGWADEKQQDYMKASIKYAIDKWGKDTVKSWID